MRTNDLIVAHLELLFVANGLRVSRKEDRMTVNYPLVLRGGYYRPEYSLSVYIAEEYIIVDCGADDYYLSKGYGFEKSFDKQEFSLSDPGVFTKVVNFLIKELKMT